MEASTYVMELLGFVLVRNVMNQNLNRINSNNMGEWLILMNNYFG